MASQQSDRNTGLLSIPGPFHALMVSAISVLVITALLARTAPADAPPETLIITGAAPYGYHPWKSNMKHIARHLEAFGLENNDKLVAKGLDDWREWNGSFNNYDVIVLIYYWAQAPEEKLQELDRYLKSGGALVVVHSALAGFWKQELFDRWTGVAYRENDAEYGHSLVFNSSGERVIRPPGEGGGSAHAPLRPFNIHTRDPDHPITNGLPGTWMQAKDELYYNLRGPNTGIHVLATAKGPKGKFHPQAWTRSPGDGRVFCLTPGHHKPGASSVGFTTLLARGIAWTATGQVNLPVPENFPTAKQPETGLPQFDEK